MEIPAVMRVGVPGAAPDGDLAVRAEAVQILGDESRTQRRMAGADFLHRLTIEIGPEIGLIGDVAEPAAVVAVGGGGDQRRKIAPLGAFVQLVIEPAVVHAGQLRVGQIPVADDDHDLLAAVFGDVRPVAQFLPAHRVHGIDVLAIDHDIAVAGPLQVRDYPHVETHLRRPEAVELISPEYMAGDGMPAGDVFVPVGLRDQRQHRMVVAGAEDFEQTLVLQMPEQLAAIDHPVGTFLEARIGQGFQQCPGQ